MSVLPSEGRFPDRTPHETSVAEDDAFFFPPAERNAPETGPTAAKGSKRSAGAGGAAVGSPAPWMETIKSLVPAAFSGKVA